MKKLAQWLIIALLIGIYLVAFGAMLHPRVSAAYKSYFVDHTASDWNPTRYPGTPEEGLQFSRPGLPVWVDLTFGLSFRDPAGRWTDNRIAKVPAVSFMQPFSGPTCIEITLAPAPALVGKEIGVRMGNETETLPALKPGYREYRVSFALTRGADKFELLLPEKLPRESEIDRNSGDTRRLGLSLSALKMLPGACAGGSVNDTK